jgi:hypothetical protein
VCPPIQQYGTKLVVTDRMNDDNTRGTT